VDDVLGTHNEKPPLAAWAVHHYRRIQAQCRALFSYLRHDQPIGRSLEPLPTGGARGSTHPAVGITIGHNPSFMTMHTAAW